MAAILCIFMCGMLYLLSRDKLYILLGMGLLFYIAYVYFDLWTYASYLRRASMFAYVLYFLLYAKKNNRLKGEE